jgi:demethylmenaquinone methyltransferase/2-methoxy-6-polyprenyl-1,4-benzoquinol methylase
MANSDLDALLRQQIAYYRARTAEYDEWFLRQGRYDRGPELNAQWFAEVATVQRALAEFAPAGRVLELACGTGLWTQVLAQTAKRITAVDSSPEALARNRKRLRDPHVEYVAADLFAWQPSTTYDVVFFSFWLSHVPPDRFGAFWEQMRSCLAPGGRIFFLDSLRDPTSTARDHHLPDADAADVTLTRRLNDGREFSIVKVFYQPAALEGALNALGWNVRVRMTERYFLYGEARPKAAAHPSCGGPATPDE